MATKRPRGLTDVEERDQTSDKQLSASHDLSGPDATAKLARITTTSTTQQRPLLCTLPPTCNPPHNKPTRLDNSAALEKHYAMYHAHVCEERGCGAVFPEERLLELHQTECHDPIAAVRKERGEKIFACLVPTCTRLFQTPKARRLHLIQAHAYPKEYFFSVTNKGVGELLKRWGEGASMVRQEWKPRTNMDVDVGLSEGSDVDDVNNADDKDLGDGDDDELEREDEMGQDPSTQKSSVQPDALVDALASTMGTLSLVPQTIRFGRGARNVVAGAKGTSTRGSRGRGTGRTQVGENPIAKPPSLAASHTSPTSRGRARIALNVAKNANPRSRAPRNTVTGHSRTSTVDSEISISSSSARRGRDQDETGNTEELVSINIDAALEALRSDAPVVGVSALQNQGKGGRGQGGRGGDGGRRRGARGRGRG